MDTLVRNATLRFSHRRSDGYEPLNHIGDVQNWRRRDGDSIGDVQNWRRRDGDYIGDVQNWRRRDGDYEHHHDHVDKRIFSRPKSTHKHHSPMMMSSLSHRRKRAKQRQIFLQTYKLASMDTSRKSRVRPKLKKFVVKVKTVVFSVLSFMRADAFKPCSSGSAICATSPSRIAKFC